MSVDLRRLLDDVAMRSTLVEVKVDPTLEQSISATVHTDRHGDASLSLTRYSADSASDALEAVLLDAARWSNEHAPARKPITPSSGMASDLAAFIERVIPQLDDKTAKDAFVLLAKVRR